MEGGLWKSGCPSIWGSRGRLPPISLGLGCYPWGAKNAVLPRGFQRMAYDPHTHTQFCPGTPLCLRVSASPGFPYKVLVLSATEDLFASLARAVSGGGKDGLEAVCARSRHASGRTIYLNEPLRNTFS